jgi:hypothetical protein
MDDAKRKLCPVQSIGGRSEYCDKDCAWYINQNCAIIEIAYRLQEQEELPVDKAAYRRGEGI